MLHQLKNGNWMDLHHITEINTHGGPGTGVRPHVVISLGLNSSRTVNFETIAEAEAYRDELAALVNEAQAEKVKPESWRNLPPQL